MLENIESYKRTGPADFLVSDEENKVIALDISDQLAMDGFMTEGYFKSGGGWHVIVSTVKPWKQTNEQGGDRLVELLDNAGFEAETKVAGQ